MKTCPRCKVTKPLEAFSPSQRRGGYCKPCHVLRVEEWRDRDRERFTRLRKMSYKSWRLRVLSHYSGRPIPCCACCGETRYEFMTIDHIEGGGWQQQKRDGRGSAIYRWLVRNDFPQGFQVMCHNCNQARGIYGLCPHERERRETASG